jgi:hypothetical protein
MHIFEVGIYGIKLLNLDDSDYDAYQLPKREIVILRIEPDV